MRTMLASSRRHQKENDILAEVSSFSVMMLCYWYPVKQRGRNRVSKLDDSNFTSCRQHLPLSYCFILDKTCSLTPIKHCSRKKRASGGRAYWIRHLRELGVYEEGNAIWACPLGAEGRKKPPSATTTTNDSPSASSNRGSGSRLTG